MSDTSQVATTGSAKRILRTAEEKRRIVEATLLPGASIARVSRENGVKNPPGPGGKFGDSLRGDT